MAQYKDSRGRLHVDSAFIAKIAKQVPGSMMRKQGLGGYELLTTAGSVLFDARAGQPFPTQAGASFLVHGDETAIDLMRAYMDGL